MVTLYRAAFFLKIGSEKSILPVEGETLMQKERLNQTWLFWKDGYEDQKKAVVLPHDAMILEDRSPDCTNGTATGFLPGGKYFYETDLFGKPEWAGQRVMLEFEGVYMNASVLLNGEAVGGRLYGYSNFFVDLTGKLKIGEDNRLLVIADNSACPNSRWYSGSGIYRPVNLWVGPQDGIEPESVKISTVSIEPAVIRIQAPKSVAVTVEGVSGVGTDFTMTIPNARLWSAETPNLYTARVKRGEDSEEIRFGIRTLAWNAKKGFQVNGETVKLRGGCVHHDHGILGAAAWDKAETRKAKTLKDLGYNAIRYSHNPAGKNFLDVCDELGLYVIDESFDQWKVPQSACDYALHFDAEWQKDVESMVSKDYNHPCVVMYCVGNEITDTGLPFGGAICKGICAKFKSLDPTRPTMIAINSMLSTLAAMKARQAAEKKEDGENVGSKEVNDIVALLPKIMASITPDSLEAIIHDCVEAVDIVGYNYGHNLYEGTHERFPERVILSSETFPARMGTNWDKVLQNDYVIGDFHWTAWDYLGEAGVGLPVYGTSTAPFSKSYPAFTANCGSVDLTGLPESAAMYTAILWGAYDRPYIGVRPVNHSGEEYALGNWRMTDSVPNWTWPGYEGRTAQIEVFSPGAEVELLQDGESLGRKPLDHCKAAFETAYRPGTLTAIAYDANGAALSRSELKSAGEAVRLAVLPEERRINAGEIAYIPVHLTDAEGRRNMSAEKRVTVKVAGVGELLALGSACPITEEKYQNDSFASYQGRVLAVVRSFGDPGTIRITAEAEGLQSDCAEIAVF